MVAVSPLTIGRTAELSSEDAVLEVGTGTGSLTARLAKEAGMIVSIVVTRPASEDRRPMLMGDPKSRQKSRLRREVSLSCTPA